MSALPPKADIGTQPRNRPLCAKSGHHAVSFVNLDGALAIIGFCHIGHEMRGKGVGATKLQGAHYLEKNAERQPHGLVLCAWPRK